MKPRAFSLVTLHSLLLALSGLCVLGSRMVEEQHDNIIRMKIGGLRDFHHDAVSNHAEIESLARFAIQEHNNKENGLLEFTKVLKAKEQVVAGKIYFLTLEAIDGGKKKLYEAKIWVKPWMNFKQLQEFRQIHAITPFKSSDLGVQEENDTTLKSEGHKLGWHEVPTLDPEIIDAASYAVKSIALRSNSLSPYELLEIVLARAKVVEDYLKLNLLLKLRRGMKEERFVVELSKKVGGRFYVRQGTTVAFQYAMYDPVSCFVLSFTHRPKDYFIPICYMEKSVMDSLRKREFMGQLDSEVSIECINGMVRSVRRNLACDEDEGQKIGRHSVKRT